MSSKRPQTKTNTSRIFGLIKEYLEHFNFTRSLESLKIDVNNSGHTFTEPNVSPSSSNSLQAELHANELMAMFSNGESTEFLSHFTKMIPKEQQLLDKSCIFLTFELQLYFMVYPLRGNPDLEGFRHSHRVFVSYLEQTAAHNQNIVNSSHARFLCLGLSSISQNPLDNFMVRELLVPEWGRRLKEKLVGFLQNVIPARGPPKLEVLVDKQTDTRHTDKRVSQLEAKCIQYKSMYLKQQKEYYNVIAVATELVESLENAILGKGVDPGTIARVCSQLYQQDVADPSLHLDFTRPGTASNMLRQSMVVESRRQEAAAKDTEQFETVAVLDIPRIKDMLRSGDRAEATYLLQAIRWRITKSSTDIERGKLLNHCVTEDLFGRADPQFSKDVLETFLRPESDILHLETFTRLIHCFCALSEGCVYLSSHSPLVSHLITTMTSSQHDDVIRQVVLGALQTLSLTRAVQSQMLATPDMMTWLLDLLSDPDELSEYTLHHTSALLMNLSLRTRGRLFLAQHTTLLFTVVEGLLEHEASLVREYINGVLFSALSMANVREKAKEVGLEDSIRLLIGISPADTATQLQYCLDQMCEPSSETDPAEGESEDEEDETVEDNLDSLTMDLQLPETLPSRSESGEQLLCGRFLTDIRLELPRHAESLVLGPPRAANPPAGDKAPRAAAANPSEGPRVRTPTQEFGPRAVPSFGPDSVPGQGGGLRHSQLGPGSRPNNIGGSEEVKFIRNPDERPIKPASQG